MTEATPRPWLVERDGDGKFLVVAPQEHDHLLITGVLANLTPGQDVANAALIVRAVNRDHHLAPLMEALERVLFYIENPAGFKEQYGDPDEPESSISWGHWRDRVVTGPLRAALDAVQREAKT